MAASGSSLTRRLASVDKKVRDRSLELLERWLLSRTSVEQSELSKIWKGLFYCYWHSDKAHVQSDLADRLSSILTRLPSRLAVDFFGEFMSTMRREWGGIDHLRMDKFYLLQRRFVQSMFKVLQQSSWDKNLVGEYMLALGSRNLMSSDSFSALGSSMHVAEVYLEEMEAAAPEDYEVFGMLLEPFYEVLSRSQDKVLVKRVKESVFDRMLAKGEKVVEGDKDVIGGLVLRVAVDRRLFEVASGGETLQGNRKLLYSLYEDFKRLKNKVKGDAVVSNLGAKFDVIAADSLLPPLEMVLSPLIAGRKIKSRKRRQVSLLKGGCSVVKQDDEAGEQESTPTGESPVTESGSGGKKKMKRGGSGMQKAAEEVKSPTGGSGEKKKVKQEQEKSPAKFGGQEDGSGKKMKRGKTGEGSGGKQKQEGSGDERLIQESGKTMVNVGESENSGSGGKSSSGKKKKKQAGFSFAAGNLPSTPAGLGDILAGSGEKLASGGSGDKTKNRKNAFGVAVSPLNTASRKRKSSSNESPELEGNTEGKKKVRFALKQNTMWKPSHPRSPAPKSTPSSSSAPKSSALKKGLLPGPINTSPVNWKPSSTLKKASSSAMSMSAGRRKKASPALSFNFNKWFS